MDKKTSKYQIYVTRLNQMLVPLRDQIVLIAIQAFLLKLFLNIVMVPRFGIPEFTFGEMFILVLSYAVLTHKMYSVLHAQLINSVTIANSIITTQRQSALIIGTEVKCLREAIITTAKIAEPGSKNDTKQ